MVKGLERMLQKARASAWQIRQSESGPVKVVGMQNRTCKSLMLNGVKPSQGKSNQLRQRVTVVAKAANFAGLRNNLSWQKVTIAGVGAT
jgi:hypothetical protein